MNKALVIFLICFAFAQLSYGQANRKLSVYLQGHLNTTRSDITLGNNPGGFGLGAQVFYPQSAKFRLVGEVTVSAYLFGDKVLRTYGYGDYDDWEPIPTVSGMTNAFVGGSYHPLNAISVSVTSGLSSVNVDNGRQNRFGIKPAVNFHFPKTQRWMAAVSYVNIFNRDPVTKQNFGSLSFSLGIRLY